MAMTTIDCDWVHSTPEMDALQAGSLKRILDLAAQLPDDWSGMLGRTTLQEDFGALRFQLAYMSYALALTHVHRLPAAPGLFREPFAALIQKILSPDCWLYWHFVSTGGGPFNTSLGTLESKWDPIAQDNIMYSAYVQSMTLLYHYLFRDSKYTEPGSLSLHIDPLFWGGDGKRFVYDENSLNELIYWAMVERGYLGIACEPNCVFQICNQPAILGFRLHDLIHGGDIAGEVTRGYVKAWEEFGIATADGGFTMMVQERERVPVNLVDAPWTDFWAGALMHAWRPDFVKKLYPGQMARHSAEGPDGTLWIKPATPPPPPPGKRPTKHSSARNLGWAAVYAVEVGDQQTLARLLKYADRFLHLVHRDGSCYHERHDEWLDADGNFASMDPHTGNALLPLARLNVPDGLKKLYDGPLDEAHFERPALVGVSGPLDLRRACFDSERNSLAVTVGDAFGTGPIRLTIGNLAGRPLPRIMRDGIEMRGPPDRTAEGFEIMFDHDRPTTLVLAW